MGPWHLAGVPRGHPSQHVSLAATGFHKTTGRNGSPSRIRGQAHTWTGMSTSEKVSYAQALGSEPVNQEALHRREQVKQGHEASYGQAYPPLGGAARP